MQTLRATVLKKIFENKENGYSVLIAENSEDEDKVVIVGNLYAANPGEELEFSGEWITDRKYGVQFKSDFYKSIPPTDEEAIKRYLIGALKGIGEKTAIAITKKFGTNTINILENSPDRLTEVSGIGYKSAQKIIKSYQESFAVRDMMMFLAKYQIPTHWAFKIYKSIGPGAVEKLRDNPFILIKSVQGIGFKKADEIFRKIGGKETDYIRIKEGLLYTLRAGVENGNIYLTQPVWLKKASEEILNIDKKIIEEFLSEKDLSNDIVIEEDNVYLKWIYYLECSVAELLSKIKHEPFKGRPDFNKEDIIEELELDDEQREALYNAWREKIFILTGGPGTGKTTILKYLVEKSRDSGLKVRLASPTGRAAKRLMETTGYYASTIHKMLEYDGFEFGRGADKKIEGDIFIVDESSMIDLFLFYHFLLAFPDNASLILVGDPYQLPPVGAGNILHQIIKSKKIKMTYLKKIYRQEESSKIIVNAHRILNGQMPLIKNKDNKDFFFINEDDIVEVEKQIIDICTERLPSYKDYNPIMDIQVLSPMYKGVAGVNRLNFMLQKKLNNTKKSKQILTTSFRIGDKVMQTVNDYDKDVTNGEIGLIITAGKNINELKNNTMFVTEKKRIIDYIRDLEFDKREELDSGFHLIVNFDGKVVAYNINEFDMLVLAYCCTVHKSQGSEYPAVIFPILNHHFIMLKRNLLYTAVTRAKEICIIIGSRQAMETAVKDDSVPKCNASLYKRIIDKM